MSLLEYTRFAGSKCWHRLHAIPPAKSYSKLTAFIPQCDETINSSLVEIDRSLMDPQPHPLLHFFVWMKPTSTNVFVQVAKNVEVARWKIWDVWRMLKCFPAKSKKFIPHLIRSMGTGVIMKKNDSIRQHSRTLWLYGVLQHPQPPRNEPHLSDLLCLSQLPMLYEHTLHYSHLQSNRKTNVWTCAFSLCMSPILHVGVSIHNNMLPAFARNVFYGECSAIWLSLIFFFLTAYDIMYDMQILHLFYLFHRTKAFFTS